MQAIITFSELLTKASHPEFCLQQMAKGCELNEQQAKGLVNGANKLNELARVNDTYAAKLVRIKSIRSLIKSFARLKKLARVGHETTAELLKYPEIRAYITTFDKLLALLNNVEVLRITLPPYKDIRALVKTPQHLEQLSKIKISVHSNSNLAQLFISYADVRKQFKSFKQVLQFITSNPSSGQLFIKDKHTISLVKNAKQLNCLLSEIGKYNSLWSKTAALELAHSGNIANLFKKQPELLVFLNYLPDQESISAFINSHKRIALILNQPQNKTSMMDMEFYKEKKLQMGSPSIPFSLLHYA